MEIKKIYLTEIMYGEVRITKFTVTKETPKQFQVARDTEQIVGGRLWNAFVNKSDKGLSYSLEEALLKGLELNSVLWEDALKVIADKKSERRLLESKLRDERKSDDEKSNQEHTA